MSSPLHPTKVNHDTQHNLEKAAVLRGDANRWFLVSLVQSLALLAMIGFCFWAFFQAQTHKEILYVKLEPNGSWSVVDYQPQDEQLLFKTTADALLSQFVTKRYGVNPATVTTDYGDVQTFLSPALRQDFLSQQGFHAAKKAEQYAKSRRRITISDLHVVHDDQVQGHFPQTVSTQKPVIRSNIYFKRKMDNQRDSENLVLRVQWTLLDKRELTQEPREFLQINPIGISILDIDLNIERQ